MTRIREYSICQTTEKFRRSKAQRISRNEISADITKVSIELQKVYEHLRAIQPAQLQTHRDHPSTRVNKVIKKRRIFRSFSRTSRGLFSSIKSKRKKRKIIQYPISSANNKTDIGANGRDPEQGHRLFTYGTSSFFSLSNDGNDTTELSQQILCLNISS
ncbi:hypothetical protein ACOME3_004090 [Neoechinorhynchus agilis]